MYDVTRATDPPEPESVCGAVFPGSHDMLTEGPVWLEWVEQWIAEAVYSGVPCWESATATNSWPTRSEASSATTRMGRNLEACRYGSVTEPATIRSWAAWPTAIRLRQPHAIRADPAGRGGAPRIEPARTAPCVSDRTEGVGRPVSPGIRRDDHAILRRAERRAT